MIGTRWRLRGRPDVIGTVVSLEHCRPNEAWVETPERYERVPYPLPVNDYRGRGRWTLADTKRWEPVPARGQLDLWGHQEEA